MIEIQNMVTGTDLQRKYEKDIIFVLKKEEKMCPLLIAVLSFQTYFHDIIFTIKCKRKKYQFLKYFLIIILIGKPRQEQKCFTPNE